MELINILKKNYKIILLIGVLLMVASFVISVAVPSQYRSTVQVLITQNYGANTDIYAAAKFTQYLSNLLNEVIYSDSFFNQVMSSGYNITNDFDQRAEKREKQWEKIVQTKVLSDTGIIVVTVYHPNRNQADQIANAIAYVLTEKHGIYHGAGDQVSIKTITGPTTSQKTVKPNILLNTGLALVLGLVLGGLFIYLFPESTNGSDKKFEMKKSPKPTEPVINYQVPENVSATVAYHPNTSIYGPNQQRSNEIKSVVQATMSTRTLKQHWGIE